MGELKWKKKGEQRKMRFSCSAQVWRKAQSECAHGCVVDENRALKVKSVMDEEHGMLLCSSCNMLLYNFHHFLICCVFASVFLSYPNFDY